MENETIKSEIKNLVFEVLRANKEFSVKIKYMSQKQQLVKTNKY